MKRCLIVIGNEGSANNFLPGVKADVENYLAYFKSNNGGAWEADEIVPRNFGWSKLGLKTEIMDRRMKGLDYALIVFVGHGYAEREGGIYFELSPDNDVSLDEIKSFFPNQKVLMIADSCQSYIPEATLRKRTPLRKSGDSRLRNMLKNKYNRQIENVCSNAFTFASAVSLGESANEDSRGGLYSRYLLSHAKGIANNPSYTGNEVVDINRINSEVRKDVLDYSKQKQTPSITITRGDVYPPFYVQ